MKEKLYARQAVTLSLMGLFVAIFAIDNLLLRKMLYGSFCMMTGWFASGAWWRPVTAGFFHSDIWHITGNLIGAYAAGTMLEPRIGHGHTLAVFLLGSTIAWAVFALFMPANNYVGASTGIYAWCGTFLFMWLRDAGFFKARKDSFLIVVIVGYFIIGNMLSGFDILFVHIIGFVAGFVLAALSALYRDRGKAYA